MEKELKETVEIIMRCTTMIFLLLLLSFAIKAQASADVASIKACLSDVGNDAFFFGELKGINNKRIVFVQNKGQATSLMRDSLLRKVKVSPMFDQDTTIIGFSERATNRVTSVSASTSVVSKTVNVMAGGLYASVTSTEKNTVTNLTITGTIDARDFITMRDSMPVLAVIDISGTTIADYNGSLGTAGTNVMDYPAKSVPIYAFHAPTSYYGKITLTSVKLPASVNSIGDYAFWYCNNLISITIPSSVSYVGAFAFYYCKGLTSFEVPPSVTAIGENAFSFCSALKSINIPSSVTSIGVGAFEGCSGLFTVDANNPNYSSNDGILFNKDQTTLIQATIFQKGDYSIPSSVTTIGNYAFDFCDYLTSITIPTSVTSIGDYAFWYCKSLTFIIIPSSVTYIGAFAFSNCSSLTSITIPSSVTSINDESFSYCGSLTSIKVYSSVPIDLESSIDAFLSVNTNTCVLFVPVGSRSAYQTAAVWKNFITIVDTLIVTTLKTEKTDPLTFYPNPVTDGFQIGNLEGFCTLTIYDSVGRTVLIKKITGNEIISTNMLLPGTYLVNVNTENGVIRKKLIKM